MSSATSCRRNQLSCQVYLAVPYHLYHCATVPQHHLVSVGHRTPGAPHPLLKQCSWTKTVPMHIVHSRDHILGIVAHSPSVILYLNFLHHITHSATTIHTRPHPICSSVFLFTTVHIYIWLEFINLVILN